MTMLVFALALVVVMPKCCEATARSRSLSRGGAARRVPGTATRRMSLPKINKVISNMAPKATGMGEKMMHKFHPKKSPFATPTWGLRIPPSRNPPIWFRGTIDDTLKAENQEQLQKAGAKEENGKVYFKNWCSARICIMQETIKDKHSGGFASHVRSTIKNPQFDDYLQRTLFGIGPYNRYPCIDCKKHFCKFCWAAWTWRAMRLPRNLQKYGQKNTCTSCYVKNINSHRVTLPGTGQQIKMADMFCSARQCQAYPEGFRYLKSEEWTVPCVSCKQTFCAWCFDKTTKTCYGCHTQTFTRDYASFTVTKKGESPSGPMDVIEALEYISKDCRPSTVELTMEEAKYPYSSLFARKKTVRDRCFADHLVLRGISWFRDILKDCRPALLKRLRKWDKKMDQIAMQSM